MSRLWERYFGLYEQRESKSPQSHSFGISQLEKERLDKEQRLKNLWKQAEREAQRQKEIQGMLGGADAELRIRQVTAAHARSLAAYQDKIRNKIRSNIILPPGIRGNPKAVFKVIQLPAGEIVDDVRIAQSSGNKALDGAIEQAIRKSSPLPLPDDRSLFERELNILYQPCDESIAVQKGNPGRSVGENAAPATFMRESAWKYRARTYELYFASSPVLARSVYGLSIQSGDVDKTMPLNRFEKGVRGFHYSVAQVCAWIDAVLADIRAVHTDEERLLMRWLLNDGIVKIVDGKAMPGGTVNHILGAASGKKRSFETNLRHERLHVLWDEDAAFSSEYRQKWNAMSAGEKQEVRKNLSTYSQSNEAQLMEEWAIYQVENLPEQERKKLMGP
jgi:hypothetical protein